jgi:hypothetical protein
MMNHDLEHRWVTGDEIAASSVPTLSANEFALAQVRHNTYVFRPCSGLKT